MIATDALSSSDGTLSDGPLLPFPSQVEIHAENVDLDGVTLHSHLYKIYTPSGLNAVGE